MTIDKGIFVYISRLIIPPKKSFFLFGPRGTGKTTWLGHEFTDAYRIDLLNEANYQRLLADPSLLARELNALSPGSIVIIDEIQRLPILLNEVHRFIEEYKHRFILCGSSARKLRKAGINLLAGRALQRFMHPFVPGELGTHFSLEETMRWGLLPIVWSDEEKEETLIAYSQTYLKEEIQAEALVRNLPGFSRFLPVAAHYHGQTINFSNIAREAGVARTTIINYIDILEDTLLCFRIHGFEARLRARERKLPKLYFSDPGIVRSITRRFGSLNPEEYGALFEGLVAQIIRAHQSYSKMCDDFYYWSSSEAVSIEVDFLVRREDRFIAIEAKSGKSYKESWSRGLRAISKLKGLCRRIIVYPQGPILRTDDDIEVFPIDVFSDLLVDNEIWP
jgi:predicted AAA+ superfamily ATPase